MAIRLAINGYGRIGRCIVRAIFENKKQDVFHVVAINDLSPLDQAAHLTKYDSTHLQFPGDVQVDNTHLIIDGHSILMTAERQPEKLPWKSLDVDIVLECSGLFTDRKDAMRHIEAGAKKVLISAPSKDADATIVYGVNHHVLQPNHTIVSNASCTTNCLATIVKPLHDVFEIELGLMNTIHSYTNDQRLLDGHHEDLRRARAAAHSIIPTKTGAASAVGLVLPELAGKLDGFAMRVPTINVSVVDLTFTAKNPMDAASINAVIEKAKNPCLYVNTLPLVSCDFNHHPASAIFDTAQTKVLNGLAKVVAWYDNEWGFSNRMLDTALAMHK